MSGRRIGLTGGIGSGKSTVAGMLAELGAAVVDTDAIARALTAPGGAALTPIQQCFGEPMLGPDGALDRERMRALVFGDQDAKQRLESILHPLIGAEAARLAESADARLIVFDVPLLAESAHWRAAVDRVLVVDCPEAIQVERVLRRSNWTEEQVRGVIAIQAPRPCRRRVADAVLDNGGHRTLAQLQQGVRAVWQAWAGHV